jgi:diadenosine tetraphosphate (Ap4A) HIT family hydrolase
MPEVDASLRKRYDTNCLFCAAACCESTELPWYLRPIHRDPACIVLPGVGSLTTVYVQVTTRAHLQSSAQLPGPQRRRFGTILDSVTTAVQATYGGVTVFEHGGMADRTLRQSACIDHAHVHVLAGDFSFTSELVHSTEYESFDDFLVNQPPDRPYLMYRTGSGPVRVASDVAESQFFRRRIAAQLDDRDRWDWAVFPQWDRVRETITFLRFRWREYLSVPTGSCRGDGGVERAVARPVVS